MHNCIYCNAAFDHQIAEGKYWECGSSQWGKMVTRSWQCYKRGETKAINALELLLMSADSSWEDNNLGHDWPEALESARTLVRIHRGISS